MARRKQSILKRDADGNVVYDDKGRAVVERKVAASGASFRQPKRATSGQVACRPMTEDERQRYGTPRGALTPEERERRGRAALLMTADERKRYGV